MTHISFFVELVRAFFRNCTLSCTLWGLAPLLAGCGHLFYQPDRDLHFPPEKLGYPSPQEIHFRAKDGTRLFGWFFAGNPKPPSQRVRGTIVQFHGNAENLSSHYVSLVWLTKQGFNLFIFDYRGYGRSEGTPDQRGTYFDGLAALDKAWELSGRQKGVPGLFLVYGQSLGGVIAIRSLADWEFRNRIDAVVLDSSFLSYRRVARRLLGQYWLTFPISPLAFFLVSDEYATTDLIGDLNRPLLVIHDRADPTVSFECGNEIFSRANASKNYPKDFWVLNDGRHVGVFSEEGPNRRDLFLKRIEKLTGMAKR